MFILITVAAGITVIAAILIEFLEKRGVYSGLGSDVIQMIFGLFWLMFGYFVPSISTPIGSGKATVSLLLLGGLLFTVRGIKWMRKLVTLIMSS